MKNTEAYDFIIVGAGSAGCAAASRLAQRSGARVLLIEAGGSDRSPFVRIPIGFAMMIGEGKHNWNYHTEPEQKLGGRQLSLPRGRLLGGCSSINGMVYIRGQREDYDGWAAAGNHGWSYSDVLPLFMRSEDYWGGSGDYHGAEGEIAVSRVTHPLPIADAFIEAAGQSGIPRNDDFNGMVQAGAGYYDANIKLGIRHNSSRAFLNSKPDNLTILLNFETARVILDGNRAVGIEGSTRGSNRLRKIYAESAVVLSAGAVNTPKLLELSGIGSASHLNELGISPIIDAPGVGENLQDHCNNYLFFRTKNCDTYYDHIRPHTAPLTLARYLLGRGGILANPAAIAGAFFNLEGNSDRPDTQIHFAAAASESARNGKLSPIPGVCASICQLQPQSRGSVHIRDRNHRVAPAIRLNLLSQESEQIKQVRAVRKLRQIFNQPAIADLISQELPPMRGKNSNEELLAGIRETLESVHHPAGTCRMGVDDNAVVDPKLRVNGIEGLRIADASVMPNIVSGNTHAACVMIGEKLADLLIPVPG